MHVIELSTDFKYANVFNIPVCYLLGLSLHAVFNRTLSHVISYQWIKRWSVHFRDFVNLKTHIIVLRTFLLPELERLDTNLRATQYFSTTCEQIKLSLGTA